MPDALSMRDQIVPHLPHLRRYARALTGSQHSGDDLVRGLLQTLADTPGALSPDGNPRLELFRLFHAGSSLPHPDRQALLLTAVEGFGAAQAAQILGQTELQVEQAVIDARAAIADMIRSRVLIIEDEPMIALHLEQMMEDVGHSVVAIAATARQAVSAAQAQAPDLLLVDIQLADGSSGIEAVASILANIDIPVIFITAFPERLLTGQPLEPAFVVNKPFDPDAVLATVAQALLARLPGFAPAT